jgi:quinol monooxygenase YgiN
MHIVLVYVHVKAECIQAFIEASLDNARNSVIEPGVARFDIIQQKDDPTRFILVEVYRTTSDPARHKETAHYNRWRDAVADMMASPRQGVAYQNLFPEDEQWS